MKNYPLYVHPRMQNINELLNYSVEQYGDKPAFRYAVKKQEVQVSYREFRDQVGGWLRMQGLQGKHIAVYGENSYAWIAVHMAVTCIGSVIVPLDKELAAPQLAELLTDSESAVCFYSETYADVAAELQQMNLPVSFVSLKSLPELMEAGKAAAEEIALTGNTLASIVYTSGTTGKSKGVMLTHGNFMACAHGSCSNVLIGNSTLLVLPLHHTFGLVANVYCMMYYGGAVYINQSLKRLAGDFKLAQPQIMFAVPLVVELLRKNIWAGARKQGKEKALRLLVRISDVLLKCGIDLRRKLFKSVLDSLGGNLEVIVSGGAPLNEETVRAFRSFGITVLNGITECGPVVAVNRNRFAVPGSVGMPLCCNEVKISPDGEVLVRGENVMQGYYHNEEENRKAFADGWFRTGDIGKIDSCGALHITGRIKNLIILSNGENIAAESLEERVLTLPYVLEAVAYGQDDLIVMEVFLDAEIADAKERIHADIQKINQTLPLVKNIGRVVVRDTEFPKTTTRKIKRNYGGNNHA